MTVLTFGGNSGMIFHPSLRIDSSEGSSSDIQFDSNSTCRFGPNVAPSAIYLRVTDWKKIRHNQQVTVMANNNNMWAKNLL